MPWPGRAREVSALLLASATAPLLYVRFHALPCARVTFLPGTPRARTHEAPVTVGLRPGYCYRVQIANLTGYPNLELYPTLEVIGSLHPCKVNFAQHPAPVVLTEQDLERIAAGALITKVIYLEHPEAATPVATHPGQPLELDVPPTKDPVQAARVAAGRC